MIETLFSICFRTHSIFIFFVSNQRKYFVIFAELWKFLFAQRIFFHLLSHCDETHADTSILFAVENLHKNETNFSWMIKAAELKKNLAWVAAHAHNILTHSRCWVFYSANYLVKKRSELAIAMGHTEPVGATSSKLMKSRSSGIPRVELSGQNADKFAAAAAGVAVVVAVNWPALTGLC